MSRPASNKLLNLLRYGNEAGPDGTARKKKKASMPAASLTRRHTRLLRVARMLDDDCTTEPEILARRLGIGRRTLYRDLALLRRAGVRLVYSRDERRYRLDSLYMRLAQGLTRQEVEAFIQWQAQRSAALTQATDLLDEALEKISRILRDQLIAVRSHEPQPDRAPTGISTRDVASDSIATEQRESADRILHLSSKGSFKHD